MTPRSPLPRDHPSYQVIQAAATRDPEKWSHLLQPEDCPPAGSTPPAPKPKPPKQPVASDAAATPGITVRVRKAGCKGGCWRWVVLVDGKPTEKGEAKTEAEAWAMAQAEADELAKA